MAEDDLIRFALHGKGSKDDQPRREERKSTPPPPSREPSSPKSKGFGWARLIAWLAVFFIVFGVVPIVGDHLGWLRFPIATSSADMDSFFGAIVPAILLAIVLAFGRWAVLGMILSGITAGSRRMASRSLGLIVAVVVGIGFVVALEGIDAGSPWAIPGRDALVCAIVSLFAGLAFGQCWRARGKWRAVGVAGLIILPIAVAIGLPTLAVATADTADAPVVASRLTTAQKRAVTQKLRDQRVISEDAAEPGRIELTSNDLTVLALWGIELGLPAADASVQLQGPSQFEVNALVALPDKVRTIPLVARFSSAVTPGRFSVTTESVTAGEISLPGVLGAPIGAIAQRLVRSDTTARIFIEAGTDLSVKNDRVVFAYDRDALPPQFIAALTGQAEGGEIAELTRSYVDHIRQISVGVPEQDRFVRIVSGVFAMAKTRSAQPESDPIAENRAAIYALGASIGHPEVKRLVGKEIFASGDGFALRNAIGRIPLRNRVDWTKHLWVSAAIELASNESTSLAIGMLKEQMDSRRGGSGFSFADLAADMAGIRFARLATSSESEARRAQSLLAEGFDPAILMPPAADLPEGLREHVFEQEYGGVNGPGYRRVVQMINDRLDKCRALN